MMIRNIILDVGMVLVDFCWQDVIKNLEITGRDFEIVADATVRSPDCTVPICKNMDSIFEK